MIIFSKKNIVSILLVFMFSVAWFGVINEAFAAEIDYTLLAPIPSEVTEIGDITNASQFKDLGGYLSFIFKAGIGIAGALAVLMLVIAGIEYMSPSANAKSEAKDRITSAIGGLLLALGSVLILTTINPNLLENFGIPKVAVTAEKREYGVASENLKNEIKVIERNAEKVKDLLEQSLVLDDIIKENEEIRDSLIEKAMGNPSPNTLNKQDYALYQQTVSNITDTKKEQAKNISEINKIKVEAQSFIKKAQEINTSQFQRSFCEEETQKFQWIDLAFFIPIEDRGAYLIGKCLAEFEK